MVSETAERRYDELWALGKDASDRCLQIALETPAGPVGVRHWATGRAGLHVVYRTYGAPEPARRAKRELRRGRKAPKLWVWLVLTHALAFTVGAFASAYAWWF